MSETMKCGLNSFDGIPNRCDFPKGHSGELHATMHEGHAGRPFYTLWWTKDLAYRGTNPPSDLGVCHRCGNAIPHFEMPNAQTVATAGFYYVASEAWQRYRNSNSELYVCDPCMWRDPLYIADYGSRAIPRSETPDA